MMIASESTYRDALKRLKCLVAIPTYNNAGTIASVVASVRPYTEDLLVVNDGSTDQTVEILASIEGLRLISYAQNRGKGHALRLALKYAAEEGFDYLLTLDADGQHYADDIPVFIRRIEQNPGALLIGARNLAADNMPSKNSFANRFSNFWYRVETGQRLSDTQSGYRLYPVKPLQHIRLLSGRYEFEVEIIVRAAWRGVSVENVPIKVYYPPAEERVSHFRPLKDFTRISLLNTVLVMYALLVYYPWRFLRWLNRENIRNFFNQHVFQSEDSNLKMALSMGLGICCGVLPVWDYQAITALAAAHLFRLNKVVSVVFTYWSIPPLIPFIVYLACWIGTRLFGLSVELSTELSTFESIGVSVVHYLVGSCVLGLAVGVVATIVAWVIMTLCKRGGSHA